MADTICHTSKLPRARGGRDTSFDRLLASPGKYQDAQAGRARAAASKRPRAANVIPNRTSLCARPPAIGAFPAIRAWAWLRCRWPGNARSIGDICRQLKDTARNAGRDSRCCRSMSPRTIWWHADGLWSWPRARPGKPASGGRTGPGMDRQPAQSAHHKASPPPVSKVVIASASSQRARA
jgi:hypothetical protein